MLETMLDRHIIFVLMGILTAVGIMSKFIVNVALKRLVRAAGNMNKSTHPLMRLVRAKFEHASMVSDKVENVRVFVDKYLYEYKVLGLRLHSWRRMEKAAAALCLLTGAAGAGLEYSVNGMSDLVWKTGAVGGGLAAFVYLVHLLTDEKYQLEAIRNYMVDFLENVCRHRFEKSYQKEIKVLAQEGNSPEFGVMPAEGQGNASDTYAVRKKETAEDLSAVRNLEQAEAQLYASKCKTEKNEIPKDPHRTESYSQATERYNQPEEPYTVRKQDPLQGQSAVSAFLAAELKAGETSFRTQEIAKNEAVNAFRTADLRVEEVANAFRMPEPDQKEVASTFRTPEVRQKESVEIETPKSHEKRKENIVEIPVPDNDREVKETIIIESPESSNLARNTKGRQALQKERMPKKEKPEEEVNRDIVIRRILEEFMA